MKREPASQPSQAKAERRFRAPSLSLSLRPDLGAGWGCCAALRAFAHPCADTDKNDVKAQHTLLNRQRGAEPAIGFASHLRFRSPPHSLSFASSVGSYLRNSKTSEEFESLRAPLWHFLLLLCWP